jgi:hypothetical protein
MGGINLLDQLKGKKNSGTSSAELSSSPKQSFNFSAGSGDNLAIALRLILYFIIGYGGFLGLQRYQEEELTLLQAELSELDTGIAQENRKKEQMKSIGEEMRGYQARVDELQGKLKAVSQQETDRSYLIRALEYASLEMPKEIWLNEITATTSTAGGNVQASEASATFKGYAINAQAVSEFIQKLEASVYFPKTTLDRLELVPGSDVGSSSAPGIIPVPANSRRFQIMAKLGE